MTAEPGRTPAAGPGPAAKPGPAAGPGPDLAGYGRRAVADGLVSGPSGNLSVRAGDEVTVTPRKVPLDALDPADCPVVSLDGRLLRGDREPSSETPMHLAIYRATGAGAVVHTHSPYATALSTVASELPAVHYTIVGLGGPLAVAPYATFGTDELAGHVLAALAGRTAALLASHGTVAYGADLAEAYQRAVLVEWLATLYVRARRLGEPAVLSEEQLAEVRERGPRLRWTA